MGQLISRLFKRLGSSRNQEQQASERAERDQQQRSTTEAHGDRFAKDSQDSCPRQKVQSIPVGQSIDSAEYTALARANETKAQIAEDVEPQGDDGDKRVGVEQAVIKIQALIRGHLTRKALKDTQQFNQLGQSHFDHETLMSSPAAPVFELPNDSQEGPAAPAAAASPQVSSKPQLDSIEEQPAEGKREQQQQQLETGDSCPLRARSPSGGRLRKLNLQAGSPGHLEMPSPSSPGLSEAGASIDLGSQCGSPVSASVSIDILDHNIRPTEKMASVLHHKEVAQEQQRQPAERHEYENAARAVQDELERQENEDQFDVDGQALQNGRHEVQNGGQSPPLGADCREQAAIRIQSAFRGYKTRKSSPYRKRSPPSAAGGQQASGSSAERLPNGVAGLEVNAEAPAAEEPRLQESEELKSPSAPTIRRQSRTRERLSFEESNTSNENSTTSSNAQQAPDEPQPLEDSSSLEGDQQAGASQLDAQSLGSTDVLTVISVGKSGAPASASEPSGCVKRDLSAEHEELRREMELEKADSLADLTYAQRQLLEASLADDWGASCATDSPNLTAALEPLASSTATEASELATDQSGESEPQTIELTMTSTTGTGSDTGSDTDSDTRADLLAGDSEGCRAWDSSQNSLMTEESMLAASLGFYEPILRKKQEILKKREQEKKQRQEATLTQGDESRMLDIEAEAERLVGELDASLGEALNEVGPDEAVAGAVEAQAQAEDEPQVAARTLEELESDDIERRDPSGQLGALKQSDELKVSGETADRESTRSSSLASSKSDKQQQQHVEQADGDPEEAKEEEEAKKLHHPKQEQHPQKPHRTKSKNRNKRKGGKK